MVTTLLCPDRSIVVIKQNRRLDIPRMILQRTDSRISMFNLLVAATYFVLLVVVVAAAASEERPCIPRKFDSDSVVCVCNATYCDRAPNAEDMAEGTYHLYESTKEGLRMKLTVRRFDEEPGSDNTPLNLDPGKTFQSIYGFGAAFTDSAGLNIRKLSEDAQDVLIRSYYCKENGSRYSMGRIPIGGTDFSTRPYTYDDVPHDDDLKQFSLAEEDHMYKIPYIRKALQLNPDIRFFAAAWTAPPWMKTNNDYTGFGFLQPSYYQTYADYLMMYLDAYKKHGIEHWALSVGNEPSNVYMPFFKINCMGWTTLTAAQWIGDNLGPTLEKSEHNSTMIMLLDDQRFELPWVPEQVFHNAKAEHYTKLIAVHWYWDFVFSTDRPDHVHNRFPNVSLIMTEACTGTRPQYNKTVDLGSWERGERYILNIIQNMRHWHTGWVDWNFALDMLGGPNWVNNNADAAIIINADRDEFYKQPMYYAIQHFSKFVLPGSHRILIDETKDVKSVAFITPLNQTVVVLYNRNWKAETVTVKDPRGPNINLLLQPFSMNTIVYDK